MPRVRLDSLLAERGLFESRTRAAAAVIAGQVHLGPGRRRAEKPGQLVDAAVELEVDGPPPYVSRGGVKLANALDALEVPVGGRRALDVGASTGGFTDCLLQRGAAHVIALDVAYGELDYRLREDARVTVIERANARAITPDQLPYAPGPDRRRRLLHLADQGPARRARRRRRREFDCLAMVKPQFEVGRERIGKGGVVRDPELRREAVQAVADAAPRGGDGLGARRRSRARPATARRSCGWPRKGGPARSTEVEAW